jgi:hypothetical protein
MALNVKTELAKLEAITTPELREQFAKLFGYESHSHNRKYLVRRIAWKLQEREYGGLSERARRRAEELARDAELRVRPPNGPLVTSAPESRTDSPTRRINQHRDPRLPMPGTVLTRRYRGVDLHVTVLEDGFEYLGERYRSLSAVAKAITGSHWNGYYFWGRALCKSRGHSRNKKGGRKSA